VQVFPFAVLIVLLIGAFLGFWLVRRFVLDPTGSPDKDTATFVEWAIKLTAFLMLFLVSFLTQFCKFRRICLGGRMFSERV
jgi:hypothetical protein